MGGITTPIGQSEVRGRGGGGLSDGEGAKSEGGPRSAFPPPLASLPGAPPSRESSNPGRAQGAEGSSPGVEEAEGCFCFPSSK